MQFILVSDWHDTVQVLSKRLRSELHNKKVLWLLSGGSNIQIASEVAKTIPSQLTIRLSVALVDERYGKVGHPDSNWQQLLNAGFSAGQARLIPALKKDLSLHETVKLYDAEIESLFKENEIVIAQLGIGDDGHTAGILPDSVASSEINDNVVGYSSNPYERVTLAFGILRQINAAYGFAFGENKKHTLTLLRDTNSSLSKQPCQILKEIDESYLYNDQLEQFNG